MGTIDRDVNQLNRINDQDLSAYSCLINPKHTKQHIQTIKNKIETKNEKRITSAPQHIYPHGRGTMHFISSNGRNIMS